MFRWRKRKVRRRRGSSVTKHYVEHKELARELVLARLTHFNMHYNLKWNRVAIRNQRRCWGSCSSLKNLNFNYKIQLLPPHLQDYIIAHELCHLKELNHGASFWKLVEETIPNYKQCVAEIRAIDKLGHSVDNLLKIQARYYPVHKAPVNQASEIPIILEQWCKSCREDMVCNCNFSVNKRL